MLPKLQTPYDELETELEELFTYMDSLPEKRRHQSPEGAWSAVQILYHLKESEKGTAAYLTKKIQAPKSEVPTGGLSSKLCSYFLSKNLRNYSKKFKAPSAFKEMPEDLNYNEVRAEYLHARENLKDVLEKFESGMLGKAYFKHPRAGRITIIQTMNFLKDHFERHAEQIKERSKAGQPD